MMIHDNDRLYSPVIKKAHPQLCGVSSKDLEEIRLDHICQVVVLPRGRHTASRATIFICANQIRLSALGLGLGMKKLALKNDGTPTSSAFGII